jgi:hypothetical protein
MKSRDGSEGADTGREEWDLANNAGMIENQSTPKNRCYEGGVLSLRLLRVRKPIVKRSSFACRCNVKLREPDALETSAKSNG